MINDITQVTDLQKTQMQELYQRGHRPFQISEMTGITTEVIKAYLESIGVL